MIDVAALGLRFIVLESIGELLIEGQIVLVEINDREQLEDRLGFFGRGVVAGDQRLVGIDIGRLELNRQLELGDGFGELVAALIRLANALRKIGLPALIRRPLGQRADIGIQIFGGRKHIFELIDRILAFALMLAPTASADGGFDGLLRLPEPGIGLGKLLITFLREAHRRRARRIISLMQGNGFLGICDRLGEPTVE